MNTFANAIDLESNEAVSRTANGMKARATTTSKVLDLFNKVGSSRGANLEGDLYAAFAENEELTLRLLQWARDVRGGAGERQMFRDLLRSLEKVNPVAAFRLIGKIPEIGRWDDLFAYQNPINRKWAFMFIRGALSQGNGLCAKWMPRKGPVAAELRKFLRLSPRDYRKLLVGLTNVVETQMCAKNWESIEFPKVPSVASARYQKAFGRHQPERYAAYLDSLKKGETKINAGAVYPYDVVKSLDFGNPAVASEQWKALPDYTDDSNILPVVDVSGSMSTPATSSLSCLDIAVSLGLYLSDKNTGAFKDRFVTFSERPELVTLRGDLQSKYRQLIRADWDMNTNLHAVFEKILGLAVRNGVPQEDMPAMILILSDMQFDRCIRHDDSAMQMIERKFEEAGYRVPKIVFWNLNARYGNVPTSKEKRGVALVSGFSPSIMKSILKEGTFSPYDVMLDALMSKRYDLEVCPL